MTSILMMMAMRVPLYRQVVFGFYLHGILQNPFKDRRRRCGHSGNEDDDGWVE
jgi:hypothetical protein